MCRVGDDCYGAEMGMDMGVDGCDMWLLDVVGSLGKLDWSDWLIVEIHVT